MSIILRSLLFCVSLATALYIHRKLKKSQMQVDDTVFWILFSVALMVLSVFPKIAIWCSVKLGVMSPANFVFLVMIFLLFVRCFLLSVKLSNLSERFKNLVEELAVRENLHMADNGGQNKTCGE